MKRSKVVGPLVILAAILWLAFGPSVIGGSGVPAVLVGIAGALGVGIGARMTDLAWRGPASRRPRAGGSPHRPPPNYPKGRDLPGR